MNFHPNSVFLYYDHAHTRRATDKYCDQIFEEMKKFEEKKSKDALLLKQKICKDREGCKDREVRE